MCLVGIHKGNLVAFWYTNTIHIIYVEPKERIVKIVLKLGPWLEPYWIALKADVRS